eukprot:TRINITY_DN8996_c0_g1_i1.p1 TRINITY_DN8996_c0_g1~~TRINITY_DN8996_c0_g1_i1.p1  ORF type:complete len:364 (+),score=65.52 TRINITY_DN8996_c0_g1_i1:156-1247(+)
MHDRDVRRAMQDALQVVLDNPSTDDTVILERVTAKMDTWGVKAVPEAANCLEQFLIDCSKYPIPGQRRYRQEIVWTWLCFVLTRSRFSRAWQEDMSGCTASGKNAQDIEAPYEKLFRIARYLPPGIRRDEIVEELQRTLYSDVIIKALVEAGNSADSGTSGPYLPPLLKAQFDSEVEFYMNASLDDLEKVRVWAYQPEVTERDRELAARGEDRETELALTGAALEEMERQKQREQHDAAIKAEAKKEATPLHQSLPNFFPPPLPKVEPGLPMPPKRDTMPLPVKEAGRKRSSSMMARSTEPRRAASSAASSRAPSTPRSSGQMVTVKTEPGLEPEEGVRRTRRRKPAPVLKFSNTKDDAICLD